MSDLEDYLDTMRGLVDGAETEVDPQRPGDLQAFKDFAREQQKPARDGREEGA
jgi:hypothetical protein